MKTLVVLGLIVSSLFAFQSVNAQVHPCGGPSPGEVVVGQTQGGQGVASVPLCQSADQQQTPQAPGLKWESRWGAIATDSDKGIVGSASDSTNRGLAESKAVADCQTKGGSQCKLQISYSNGCGAMVLGDNAFALNIGSTKEEAIAKATKVCSADSKNCQAYFTSCSPAALVR